MLVSGGCPWDCYFCGYGKKRYRSLSHGELKEQVDNYFKGFEKNKIDKLKIDIPGSFLDQSQIPIETRKYLVDKCKNYGIDEIEIETRPEFVNKEDLSGFKDIDLTVAIGLDVADDYYLRKLNKGFNVSDYEDSARIVKSLGFNVKTYVLVNPPFVDDAEKILDKSVREALDFSDSVVLINCYPHEDTVVKQKMQSEEEEEKLDWEPLTKEEFFELTKKWLVKSNIEYDVRRKQAPPIWKAWIPRFSEEEKIVVASGEGVKNPKFETWQKFLREKYNPPENKEIALLLPRPVDRPFLESNFYKKINSSLEELDLQGDVHKIIVSLPGAVPEEFLGYYPFDSYEFNLDEFSEEDKEKYVEIISKRLRKYIESHQVYYDKYFSLFKPNTLHEKILEKVSEGLDIKIENCLQEDKDLTDESVLESLQNILGNN